MEKILARLKGSAVPLSLLAISAIVYHRWLSFGLFYYGDYLFRFSETLKDYAHISLWNGRLGLGGPNLTVWMILFDALTGWFGRFGWDSNVADKLTVFWPFVFLTPLSAYWLAKHILKSEAGAFVAAIAYSFNTYFLAIDTQGHFSLSVAASFAPLACLFLMRSLEEGSFRAAVLAALSLFAVSSYDFRVAYIEAFVLAAYALAFLAFDHRKESFRRRLIGLAIFGVLFFLLNAYWIIGFAKMGSLADNEVLSRDLIDFSLDLPRAITLFHPFWNGAEPVWFKAQGIPAYFFLVPILAVIGLGLMRRNRNVIFFAGVALLGILLSKQASEPFPDLYYWLHRHLPGFSAFREASKFYFLIALGYAILIGAFAAGLAKRFPERKTLGWSAVLLASGLFLWNARSVIDGRMGSILVPRHVSQDEAKLRSAIDADRGFSRTLFVPLSSGFMTYGIDHPKIEAAEMEKTAWAAFGRNPGQGGDDERTERIRDVLSRPYADNLLDESAIHYVVIPQKSVASWKPTLDAAAYLRPVDLGIKELAVYENADYRPLLYLSDRIETVQQKRPFVTVEYMALSETEYLLRVRNLSAPAYLSFSEAYHPDWRLAPAGSGWLSDILGRTAFLPAAGHRATDAGLNSFRLDPEEIAKSFPEGSYERNPDGSLDIDLRLAFVPQSWLRLGLVVSVASLIAAIAYLVRDSKRRHNGKDE